MKWKKDIPCNKNQINIWSWPLSIKTVLIPHDRLNGTRKPIHPEEIYANTGKKQTRQRKDQGHRTWVLLAVRRRFYLLSHCTSSNIWCD